MIGPAFVLGSIGAGISLAASGKRHKDYINRNGGKTSPWIDQAGDYYKKKRR